VKHPAQSPTRRAGFTLVELLVALALAVVVTALVLATLAITNRTRRSQADRVACRALADRALGQLARDLERAFVFPKNDATAFTLSRGAAASNAVLELAFARMAPLPGEDHLRWAEVARVAYRLTEAGPTNFALTCTTQPLAGPAALQPVTTNAVFQGLEAFDVALFDGKLWKDTWIGSGASTNGAPRAARITLAAQRGLAQHAATAEVIIPVGLKFEPPKKDKVQGKNISEIH
jgi:type II secretion system protein J